jgi:regulator of protease activity HflC (stomatin/prohibitin superfamily)
MFSAALILVGLVALVCFNLPGKAWRRVDTGKVLLVVRMNRRSGVTSKSPIVHVWWLPFRLLEFGVIYPYLPQQIHLKPLELPTGGAMPTAVGIRKWGFEGRILDFEKAFFVAPKGNPIAALATKAAAAITLYLIKTDIALLNEQGLGPMEDAVLAELQRIADGYGVEVSDFWINDVDWPQVVMKAAEIRRLANAEAAAANTASQAEVRNYRREKRAQGQEYIHIQALQALMSMAKDGALRTAVLGDLQALFGSLIAREEESHGDKP